MAFAANIFIFTWQEKYVGEYFSRIIRAFLLVSNALAVALKGGNRYGSAFPNQKFPCALYKKLPSHYGLSLFQEHALSYVMFWANGSQRTRHDQTFFKHSGTGQRDGSPISVASQIHERYRLPQWAS